MSGAPRQLCPSCGTPRVAQPSSSAQVRKLEAWPGIVIFERNTRRVIVTADGRSVVGQARRVLAETRPLFTIVQRSGKPFGGMLRLAAISTLGPYLFPSLRRSAAALTSAGIFSEPLLLACPKGHPAGAVRPWARFDAEQRLLREEGHCLCEQTLISCSTRGRIIRLATSLETLKYMVAAGEGCTLVPALAVS
jgi:LysR family hydrogen peroxide-inducible transcriptional activator